MKKVLSIILVLMMMFSIMIIAPVNSVSAATSSKTLSEAMAWCESKLNQKVGDGWCVAFANAYLQYLGIRTVSGDGEDWRNSPIDTNYLTRIQGATPQAGDILIWTGGSDSAGHVAVCASANTSYHQMWDGPWVSKETRASNSNFTYDGSIKYYWGVLRPNFSNGAPHTSHNYNTYVYYWAAHPHYKCYKCSCGEVKENRNEPTYVSSCSECNHTHNYNTHSHYGTEHPHYEYLKCSCGATQVNTSKTTLVNGCDKCYPGTPTLNVRAGTSAEYVQFYWEATANTDEYELKIYDAHSGERVSYHTGITTINYQVKLPAGDYIVNPLSIKNSLRDTDRWWTSGAEVSFTVTEGEFKPSYEYTSDGKRYELYNITMPWTEAKAKCEELGGHLVTITSKEEADIVNNLVIKGGRANYWIGMSDSETEGQWKNITGENVSYTNWAASEPNDYLGVEDYGVIVSSSICEWNDLMNNYGSYSIGFICEYDYEEDNMNVILTDGEYKVGASWDKVDNASYYVFEAKEHGTNDVVSEKVTTNSYDWCPISTSGTSYDVKVTAYGPKNNLIAVEELTVVIDELSSLDMGYYGDADKDGSITVIDATNIQRHLALITKLDGILLELADADGDNSVTVVDATTIQRYIALLPVEGQINEQHWWYSTTYLVHFPKWVESEWTLADDVPEDAEIVDEKWTYDLVTRTTSSSSTAPAGYTQEKDPTWVWGAYGSWSDWSKTVYTASDSRQVENKYYAATTKTVWKYSRDVNSAGTLSTYSLGYYGNNQYITLDYRLSSTGTVDGHTRYGPYDGGYGSYLKNYWWNESQATQTVTPAYYMYRYRDRSKVYTYYYHKVEPKESVTEINSSDTVTNVKKWVKYKVY